MPSSPLSLAAGLALLFLAAPAPAGDATPIPHDHYRAGGDIDLRAEVLGDLVVAGLWTRFDGRVAGDVLAAGGRVELHGRLEDDVRAAGGRVRLDGTVGDEAVLAGLDVVIGPHADVGGRARLAGGRVRVDGRVRGALDATGGEVTLAGRIDGPVHVRADRLRILAGARVDGDVVYRAPDPAEVQPGARIGGALTFHHAPDAPSAAPPGGAPADGPAGDGPALGAIVLRVLALLVPGMLLRLAVPGLLASSHATLAREPLLSLGVGGALLVLGPVVALGLCLFVVTIPLSIAALMLAVPLALAGYLVSAGMLAERAAARVAPSRAGTPGVHALALAAVLLALALLQALPIAGILVLAAAILCGAGAGSIAAWRRLRPVPPA